MVLKNLDVFEITGQADVQCIVRNCETSNKPSLLQLQRSQLDSDAAFRRPRKMERLASK